MSRGSWILAAAFLLACGEEPGPGMRSTEALGPASQAPFFRPFGVAGTGQQLPGAGEPGHDAVLGDRVFFTANGGGPYALWVTDGTDPGTVPIFSTPVWSPAPSLGSVVAFDGGVYFWLPEVSPYPGHWYRTEGRPGQVTNIAPVRSFQPSGEQRVFQGALYVVAGDYDHGVELWKSDGTAEGTALLADIARGGASSSPASLTVVGSTLFFAADDGTGRGLWRTDGTAAGTWRLGDADAGPVDPTELAPANGRLYFSARRDGETEAWSSNGTNEGTRRLQDTVPSLDGGSPRSYVESGGALAFLAGPGLLDQFLWWVAADGGSATGFGYAVPPLFPIDGGVLLAGPTPGSSGFDLLFSPGPGTLPQVLGGLGRQDDSPGLVDPVAFQGRAYFGSQSAADPAAPSQLWTSDGTPEGSHPVLAPSLALEARDPHHLAATPLGLLFAGGWPEGDTWLSDGTDAGTHRLMAPVPSGFTNSFPTPVVVSGDLAYWTAHQSSDPAVLWRAGIDGGADPVTGTEFVAGLVVFAPTPRGVVTGINNGPGGWTVWLAGPSGPVTEVPGVSLYDPAPSAWAALDGGAVVFAGLAPDGGVEPWVSDGTVAGTRQLAALLSDGGSSYPVGFNSFAGRAVFFADQPTRVFVTDGSSHEAIFTVPDVVLLPVAFAASRDRFFFASTSSLYVSDGTRTEPLIPFPPSTSFSGLTALPDRALFQLGGVLYATDGTTAGTAPIASSDTEPFGTVLAVGARRVWLVRSGPYTPGLGNAPESLWTSDGTDAGTRWVADVQLDINYSVPPYARWLGVALEPEERLLFPARSDGSGSELWVSDGTAEGTRPVVEIARGVLDSKPDLPVRLGNVLVVPAHSHLTGRELWSIDMAAALDRTPPDLNCPAPIEQRATEAAGLTVSFSPTAHDAVSGVQVIATPASGSRFPVGTTMVRVTATDAFGNTTGCDFSVTVLPPLPPLPDSGIPDAGPPGDDGGGGCSATGGEPTSVVLALLLGVAVSAFGVRRHRPVAAVRRASQRRSRGDLRGPRARDRDA